MILWSTRGDPEIPQKGPKNVYTLRAHLCTHFLSLLGVSLDPPESSKGSKLIRWAPELASNSNKMLSSQPPTLERFRPHPPSPSPPFRLYPAIPFERQPSFTSPRRNACLSPPLCSEPYLQNLNPLPNPFRQDLLIPPLVTSLAINKNHPPQPLPTGLAHPPSQVQRGAIIKRCGVHINSMGHAGHGCRS